MFITNINNLPSQIDYLMNPMHLFKLLAAPAVCDVILHISQKNEPRCWYCLLRIHIWYRKWCFEGAWG